MGDFFTWMNNALANDISFKALERKEQGQSPGVRSEADIVKVGAWGGSGGSYWECIPNVSFAGIIIRSGSVIDAISFVITDGSGNYYVSGNYGGDGGTVHEIVFEGDEEIVKVSGRSGTYDTYNVITSLTFETNKRTYGPYGSDGGTDFSLPVKKGKIVGFHGTSGGLLDSIGVVLIP